jgi:hypothetical protein
MVDDKTDNDKQSTLSAGHFDCHGGAPVQYKVHCPIWKPLDAAIGQLLTPYCSHGRHINSKQNNNVKGTHFASRF